MDEQRVYTQSEVIDIVRTIHNLQVLDDLLRVADFERERYVRNQQARREALYSGVSVNEKTYMEGLVEGDRKVAEQRTLLQRTLKDYEALPKSMQQTLCDLCDLDLDKIRIHLI